ncbi:molecular chaperone DnaJ [Candidatus Uhrbacteria bacterium]|nr:molecular chaperone DnaJ [Candidatus Uhrbacteria bacterium]
MKKDYYAILGVSTNATSDEIKKAFRKLAHQHHPDKEGGDATKFKEANEAYQVLSDDGKRKKYDQFGADFDKYGGGSHGHSWEDYAQQSGFGFNNGVEFDMSDLGEMFGDMFGFGGGRRSSQQSRGANLQLELAIDFREAAFGEKKDVRFSRQVSCVQCAGTGAEKGSPRPTCKPCNGSGQVVTIKRSIFGAMQTASPCAPCKGTGTIIEKSCKECHGEGRTRKDVMLSVSIPAGIDDGETIRLRGEGDTGQHGMPSGDLFIRMRVKPDKRFVRQGADLYCTVPLKITDSILGATIPIDTLDGEVDMKVPAGTKSGTQFRLANLGVHYLNKNGRGSLIAQVDVAPPKSLYKKQKELLEQLKKEGL